MFFDIDIYRDRNRSGKSILYRKKSWKRRSRYYRYYRLKRISISKILPRASRALHTLQGFKDIADIFHKRKSIQISEFRREIDKYRVQGDRFLISILFGNLYCDAILVILK